MENVKGSSNISKSMMYTGKASLLPPKIPFPSISPSYVEYIPSNVLGRKGTQKPKESNAHHQRTSSESFLVDEQPSWLDELLNEPETPVRKGSHRRSSSDSSAYMDMANAVNFDYAAKDENISKNMTLSPSWGFPDFDYYRDARQAPFYSDPKSSGRHKNQAWDSPVDSRGLPSTKEKKSSGPSPSPRDVEGVPSTDTEKLDTVDSDPHEAKISSERKESSHAKPSPSESDTKRAKQQFAQRSRVRKLQYIAELERNVHALQAEGSDISAELEFLNQQNLILSMENKALKQRLESIAQEQLIKHLEHEVLEREIGRLRAMYQLQQQQQQQPPSTGLRRTSSRDLDQHQHQHQHQLASGLRWTNSRDLDQLQQQQSTGLRRTSSRDLDQLQQPQLSTGLQRTSSRDLDQHFVNLSIKHKEASAAHDPTISGQLQI